MPKLPVMRFFTYAHLPTHLQEVSKPFCALTDSLVSAYVDETEGADPELKEALRHLLLAKDAAVRTAVEHNRKK